MTFAPSTKVGKLLAFGGATAVCLAMTGCSVFDVCPAIAWNNTVIVKLEGDVRNVSVVELCAEGVCSVPAPVVQPSDDPVRLETLDPQQLGTFTPGPSAIQLPYFASRIDDRTWEISIEMGSPDRATLRALAASGEILAERDLTLAWVRVGGSERCGGPAEAGPIRLTITS